MSLLRASQAQKRCPLPLSRRCNDKFRLLPIRSPQSPSAKTLLRRTPRQFLEYEFFCRLVDLENLIDGGMLKPLHDAAGPANFHVVDFVFSAKTKVRAAVA